MGAAYREGGVLQGLKDGAGRRDPRVIQLQQLLMDTEEPRPRARAHLELGRIALRRRKVEQAIRHFREAALLDPHLEAAHSRLRALGASLDAAAPPRVRGLRQRLRAWLGRGKPAA